VKLSIATNWRADLVEALAPYPVKELFGSLRTTPVGGGRPSAILPEVSRREAEAHIRAVREAGWEFNYLLNGMCLGGAPLRDTEAALLEQLEWLEGLGVQTITAAHPFVLETVKAHFSGFRVKVSILPDLDTVTKVKNLEALGADEIALSIMANRDFEFLEAVVEAVGCDLTLLVNQACLYMCSQRLYHGAVNAHASMTGADDSGFGANYCLIKCAIEKLTDPVNLIKSRWIRPEDLSLYEAMGYETFKIAGREMDTPWLENAARAYSRRSLNGNLAEVLNGVAVLMSAGGPETRRLPFIDNRKLDGFLDHFRERRCRRHCVGCAHCAAVAKEAVNLFRDENARFVETLSAIAGSIVS
jgi:collagenase-like PrtC family protease